MVQEVLEGEMVMMGVGASSQRLWKSHPSHHLQGDERHLQGRSLEYPCRHCHRCQMPEGQEDGGTNCRGGRREMRKQDQIVAALDRWRDHHKNPQYKALLAGILEGIVGLGAKAEYWKDGCHAGNMREEAAEGWQQTAWGDERWHQTAWGTSPITQFDQGE